MRAGWWLAIGALSSVACHPSPPARAPARAARAPAGSPVVATVAPIEKAQAYLIEHPVPAKVVSTDELEEGMERAAQDRAAVIAEGAARHEGDVVIGSKKLLHIRDGQLATLAPAIDALRRCYQRSKARSKTMHGRLVFTVRYASDATLSSTRDPTKPPKESRVALVTTSLREETISVEMEKCSAEAIRTLTVGRGVALWMPFYFVDED